MARWDADSQFEAKVVTKVERGDEWTGLTFDDGWSLAVPTPAFAIKPGHPVRLYGEGLGRPVRGVVINGQEVYYRTPDEQRAKEVEDVAQRQAERRDKWNAAKAGVLVEVGAMPLLLRDRWMAFYDFGGDAWGENFGEYELFACKEAAKIAAVADSAEAVQEFAALPWEQQVERADLSTDHSGNTFGAACRLARWLVSDTVNVAREHGALCPLVGCTEYGCWTARKAATAPAEGAR